jgi:PAS domain S-box-containing protein
MKLSTQVTLLILVTTSIIGLLTAVFANKSMSIGLEKIDQEWTGTLASSLSVEIEKNLAISNSEKIKRLLLNVVSTNKELTYAYVSDANNQIITHTFDSKLPSQIENNQQSGHLSSGKKQLVIEGERIDEYWYPISTGESATVHLGRSQIPDQEIIDRINVNLAALILSIGILAAAFALPISHRMSKPIERLCAVLNDYRESKQFDQTKLLKGSQEINILGNTLTSLIKDTYETIEQSERNRARLEAILRFISDAIIVSNQQRRIVMINEATNRIFGYKDNELVGKTTDILYADQKDFVETGKIIRETRSVHSIMPAIEIKFRRKDGSSFWGEGIGTHIALEGNFLSGIITAVRDITDRKKIEEELVRYREGLEHLVELKTTELKKTQESLLKKERLATLGQLTATVSHELRNPLGALKASLYILKNKLRESDKNITSTVDRIDRNISRCDHIIDELLDYTRITKLSPRKVDLDAWLAELLGDLEIHNSIAIHMRLGLNHRLVEFDDNRMRRVIINVVENACHAMIDEPSNDVKENAELTISTSPNDKQVTITISDNGIGIPPEVLDRIFEPLYSTKGFGVGLGMPTIKQIVEQHNGSIDISTQVGIGTSVSITIPIEVATDTTRRTQNMPTTESS